MKYVLFALLAFPILFTSCSSSRRKLRSIPREKVGKETVFHIDDMILFYDNADGFFYLDTMYFKKAGIFVFNFTNTEDPTVIIEKVTVISGDASSDLIRVEREQSKWKKKYSKDKNKTVQDTTSDQKKIKLKPVPTENFFKVEEKVLQGLFEKDVVNFIRLEGRKKEQLISYQLEFDKSDLISLQSFYESVITADDKKVRVDDK